MTTEMTALEKMEMEVNRENQVNQEMETVKPELNNQLIAEKPGQSIQIQETTLPELSLNQLPPIQTIPTEPLKRKRGRPRKIPSLNPIITETPKVSETLKPETTSFSISDSDDVAVLAQAWEGMGLMVGAFIPAFRPFSREETKALATTSEPVVKKYFPDYKNQGPEIVFALTAIGIVMPRIMECIASSKKLSYNIPVTAQAIVTEKPNGKRDWPKVAPEAQQAAQHQGLSL